jgi:hypothetical protein
MTFTLAQVLSKQESIVAIVAAVIVLAIAAFGFQDVGRFSFRRVRAIAGVSFREAIRRRVLYVTPLAMVGVIAISQLTLPFDEQDAIRQTTRYCLFAAGMIVVVTALLLAATNLPKEIESRVIFTIVTKPTTRLEIVLGKVLGFSLVSGMILLIMGLFTFTYLQARQWALVKNVKAELARMEGEETSRPSASPATRLTRQPASAPATGPSTQSTGAVAAFTDNEESEATAAQAATELNQRIRKQTLRRYADGGLLGTKAIAPPADLQIYARDPGPDAGPNSLRWIGVQQQLYFLAPMVITEADRDKIQGLLAQNRPPYLVIRLTVEQQKNPLPEELRELEQGSHPLEAEVFGPMTATAKGTYKPQIVVNGHSAATGQFIARELFQARGAHGVGSAREPVPLQPGRPASREREYRIMLGLPSADQRSINLAPLNELLEAGRFNIEVAGFTPTFEYGAGPVPVSIVVPAPPAGPGQSEDFDRPLFRLDSSTTESIDPPIRVAGRGDYRNPPGVRFRAFGSSRVSAARGCSSPAALRRLAMGRWGSTSSGASATSKGAAGRWSCRRRSPWTGPAT